MARGDELLFGAEPTRLPDSDGDGTSDLQERLDGTNANDASDHVATGPILEPRRDATDPRGDLRQVTLERDTILDTAGTTPAGKSVEQGLPTGLDGKPISGGPNHHGNTQADSLLAGRGADPNSPFNVERDPTQAGSQTTAGSGHGSGTSGAGKSGGGTQGSLPPGFERAGGLSSPSNMDLVGSSDAVGARNSNPGELAGLFTGASAEAKKDPSAAAKANNPDAKPLPGAIPEYKPKPKDGGTMTNPDGDGSGGTVTEDDVARAVAVHGGATDFVRGFEGPHIEGDAPPKSPRDLVTDPGDEGGETDAVSTTTARPPQLEISHTINPDAGFDPTRSPSPGPGPGGGGGGGGGGNTGRDGFSSAATAATATSGPESAGVVDVTGTTGGGIQSVAAGADGVGGHLASFRDPSAMPAGIIIPDIDHPLDVGPGRLDIVSDATAVDVAPFDAPDDSFANRHLDDDLARPAEVGLDDGF